MNKLNISVLGCGSWGGTIAQHLTLKGFNIIAWHKFENEVIQMKKTRQHLLIPQLQLDTSINITSDLSLALKDPEIIVVAVPSHIVRSLITEIASQIPSSAIIVNLAKGIENDSLLTMSQVIQECSTIPIEHIVTLYGPSHAEEVALKLPTTLVSSSKSIETANKIQNLFSSENLRIYSNQDILGAEIGGSLKNVIAIATGICDGIGFGDNTKAALLTRGITEITRLGVAMGADSKTFFGLSGIGDLMATCFSQHSRNRYVGEKIGRGEKLEDILAGMKMVAEGVKSTTSAYQLSKKYKIEMPIANAVYHVLFEGLDPLMAVKQLMTRDLKIEAVH